MERERLFGKTLAELTLVAEKMQLKPFAAKQMADWLYKKSVTDIGQMTNIPAVKRQEMQQFYEIGTAQPVESVASSDGTKKYLFRADGKGYVEAVAIPDKERVTLCVSSQVGCKMNCLFCMTGKQGFSGNLTSGEILNQIQSVPEFPQLTNLVFMGMGEPMDNLDELLKALEIITSSYGYAWSPRRITVSTIGITSGVLRFLRESDCHLAVSLHAPTSEIRRTLMPVERPYPFKKLLDELRNYDFSGQRRLSFEYILFDGVNDTDKDAEELARWLQGLMCRVNLIRFHAIPGVSLQGTQMSRMTRFRDILNEKGIICTIRASRGEDILAACGMLSTSKIEQTLKK
ncbi:MAG: 23S rRNA (adenine(2503)-C(2))-methyltransferase RlmN [Bacteroidales bacterium]|nr:23S rRNA (adenine(2503)-C(2))-methyltransferase RlmN [Bacteroidales bacterium]